MRITTGMLDKSAREAGLPINRSSLINYINGGSGNSGALLNALKSKTKTDTAGASQKPQYEKQEKNADALYNQMQKFIGKGSDSLFAKAKESGDTSKLCGEVETLAERYNMLYSVLSDATDSMNLFYKQSMKDLVKENEKGLEGIGISVGSNGKLTVDKEKLGAASVESLEQMLGEKSSFASKLSYVASRVENNAGAALESISSSYLPNGSSVNGHVNKYDFWG